MQSPYITVIQRGPAAFRPRVGAHATERLPAASAIGTIGRGGRRSPDGCVAGDCLDGRQALETSICLHPLRKRTIEQHESAGFPKPPRRRSSCGASGSRAVAMSLSRSVLEEACRTHECRLGLNLQLARVDRVHDRTEQEIREQRLVARSTRGGPEERRPPRVRRCPIERLWRPHTDWL